MKSSISGLAVIGIAFFVTAVIARLIIAYADKLQLLDVPNERSSHTKVTASGGGLSFVSTFLIGSIVLLKLKLVDYQLVSAFWGGGFLVAFVGLVDDLGHVPAAIRLLIHTIAAIWVLWVFHGMPVLTLGFFAWHWHKLGTIVGILGLVWLINLYNFMDGIDGLAASEAIFVAFAIFLTSFFGANPSLGWILLLLASSVFGFLIWNWPPAKIFMGDIGSGFLGYVFGVLLIASAANRSQTVWQWLILLGVFWIDATVTLIRRIRHGEKWYEAHRTYAFQIAATQWNSHKLVVICVSIINVVWLFPLSLLAMYYRHLNLLITLVAIAPLFVIWIYLNSLNVFKSC